MSQGAVIDFGAMNGNDENRDYGSRRMADLPRHMRPREIFDRLGAEHVQDDVLLAILLRFGVPGSNVSELAKQLLNKYESLTAIALAPVEEIVSDMKGIGATKARELKASLELARRMSREGVGRRPFVTTPDDVAAILREDARLLQNEVFWVLLLDTRKRMIGAPRRVSEGILDASLVHSREVFKAAVSSSAQAVILAHNHPSGDPTPSAEDIKITRRMVEAGRVLEMPVLDHVIVGRRRSGDASDFISIRESGLIKFDD